MSVQEDFIRVEITTGQTMVEFASAELKAGKLDVAQRAFHKAKVALDTARRFMPFIASNNKSYEELNFGIERLQRAMDQYERDQHSTIP